MLIVNISMSFSIEFFSNLQEMYNEADMTFKFKTWEHLVGNAIVGELIPNEFKDEIEAVV